MYDLNYDEMTKEELIQYIKECKEKRAFTYEDQMKLAFWIHHLLHCGQVIETVELNCGWDSVKHYMVIKAKMF